MNTKIFDGTALSPVGRGLKPHNASGKMYVYNGADCVPINLNSNELLYRFGALSDVHIQYSTAETDFVNACDYLRDNGTSFACICGDLTDDGDDQSLGQYKSYADAAELPIYAIAGNHEGMATNADSRIESYTGYPLYYKIERGNDVFIFLGVKANAAGSLFTADELDWLQATLKQHRNQRCFLFEHVRPDDACGNAYGIYTFDIWGGSEAIGFENLLKHYKNVIFFHGHSHLKLEMAKRYGIGANIDTTFGMYSIHIPSLAVPRDGGVLDTSSSRRELYAKSQGYIVEVYEHSIKLNGFELAEYNASYSSSKFNVGDCCRHDGKLYIANTDITEAEPWNPAHWDLSPSDYVVEYELDTTLTNVSPYSIEHISTPAELARQSSWEIGSISSSSPYAETDADNYFRSKHIEYDESKTYQLQYTSVFLYNGVRIFYYDTLGACLGVAMVSTHAVINDYAPADTAYWRIRTYGGSNNEGYNYLTQAFSFTVS